MSVLTIAGSKISSLAPLRDTVQMKIGTGYLGSKKFASELAWKSMVMMLASMIPDDFYDWQDPAFDVDATDVYSI